jgi:hypothetical protein
MKAIGFSFGKRDKPRNYYRGGVSVGDFCRAMKDMGPLSVTQVAGLISDIIPPEAKVRCFELHRSRDKSFAGKTTEQLAALGVRELARMKLIRLHYSGKVRKHGSGKETKYEWIEAENDSPKGDPPGRGHAVKGRAKRGRNKRVRRPVV